MAPVLSKIEAHVFPTKVQPTRPCLYPQYREERQRLGSYAKANRLPPGEWAIKMAEKGLFYEENDEQFICFDCGAGSQNYPQHSLQCNWQEHNIPFRSSSQPTPGQLGLNIRHVDGPPSDPPHALVDPQELSLRMRTVCRESDMTRPENRAQTFCQQRNSLYGAPWMMQLALAGFYRYDHHIAACFSCGWRVPVHLLLQTDSEHILDHALALHIHRGPRCTYVETLAPPQQRM